MKKYLEKLKPFLYPSFVMEIERYDKTDGIKLVGSNNWNTLLFSHAILILLIIVLVFFFCIPFWNHLFIRLVSMALLFGIVGFSFNKIKEAKNKKYIREEIIFDKKGIHLKNDIDSNMVQTIKTEYLRRFYLIVSLSRFKFMIYDRHESLFEFEIDRTDLSRMSHFVEDIAELFQLEINSGARFNPIHSIIEFQKKKEENLLQRDSNKPELSSEDQTSVKSFSPNKKKEKPYTSKYWYKYKQDNRIIVKEDIKNQTERKIKIAQKFEIDKNEGVIRYRLMMLVPQKIKLLDITDISCQTAPISRDNEKYIEAALFIHIQSGKRRKVLSTRKAYSHQFEVLAFDMLKDFQHLKKIIVTEIGRPRLGE